jgi:DNA polymerase III alpha subunit
MIELLNDSNTMLLFKHAETHQLTHFNDRKSRAILKKLEPKNVQELCNIYSLTRPITENKLHKYVANVLKPDNVEYKLESFKKYLKNTYGVLIYHEQLIAIIADMAKVTNYTAIVIVKAMQTKNAVYLTIFKKYFVLGCHYNVDFVYYCTKNRLPMNTAIDIFWNDFLEESTLLFSYSSALICVLKSYEEAKIEEELYIPSNFRI